MEKYVRKVMPAGLQTIKLAVEHVCDCCQRMPILGVDMRKRPDNIGKAKAGPYPGVLIDITRVVVIHEIESECSSKDGPCKQREADANAGI